MTELPTEKAGGGGLQSLWELAKAYWMQIAKDRHGVEFA